MTTPYQYRWFVETVERPTRTVIERLEYADLRAAEQAKAEFAAELRGSDRFVRTIQQREPAQQEAA